MIQGGPECFSFCSWYDRRYQTDCPEALEDRGSKPSPVWNRTPDEDRARTVDLALDGPELTHVNWQYGSPTQRVILSLKASFICF